MDSNPSLSTLGVNSHNLSLLTVVVWFYEGYRVLLPAITLTCSNMTLLAWSIIISKTELIAAVANIYNQENRCATDRRHQCNDDTISFSYILNIGQYPFLGWYVVVFSVDITLMFYATLRQCVGHRSLLPKIRSSCGTCGQVHLLDMASCIQARDVVLECDWL